MEITTYQVEAKRTLPFLDNDALKVNIDTIHMLFGLSTEVGELTDIFKKYLAYGKPIDEEHAKKEVGDIMWYLVNLCTINNWDLSILLDMNVNKLKARYKDKFTSEEALNRSISDI